MADPSWILLIFLGLLVGSFGTLIGAGGGFLLVPLLLYLYPSESPATLTSISLAVVALNALSGTAAYARAKRIRYRTGMALSAASVPATAAGAVLSGFLPRGYSIPPLAPFCCSWPYSSSGSRCGRRRPKPPRTLPGPSLSHRQGGWPWAGW